MESDNVAFKLVFGHLLVADMTKHQKSFNIIQYLKQILHAI
jgi:hypothetical protein